MKELENNYRMEQSITGYWILLKGDEIIHDDPASEDVYDMTSAEYLFREIIKERELH